MAYALIFLSDLQTGWSSSTVEVCLLCFWEARNVRCGEELMGVDMLLLDFQVNLVTPILVYNFWLSHFPTFDMIYMK
ncbi:hypothetical protein Bca4012_083518 [Brassica carinata]